MGFGIATLLLLTLHAWTTHMTTQLRGYGAESIKSSAEELLKHLHREEGSLHQMIVRSIYNRRFLEDLFADAYATLFNYQLVGVKEETGAWSQQRVFGPWQERSPEDIQQLWSNIEPSIRSSTLHPEGLCFIEIDTGILALYTFRIPREYPEKVLVIGRQLPSDFISFESTSDNLYRFAPASTIKANVLESWDLTRLPALPERGVRDDHRFGRAGRPTEDHERTPRGRGGPPPRLGASPVSITHILSESGLDLTTEIRTTESGKTKSLIQGSLGKEGPILEILVNRALAEQLDRHANAYHWIAGGVSIAMILFTIVVVRAMRQRQLAEAMLQTRNQHLDVTNQRKDRLLSIIAHDLRAPLSGVTNLSGLLARQPESFDPEDIRQYAEEIQSTSKHLSELLENLLNWARLQTGQLPFYPGQIDLHRATHQIKALFHSTARDKGVELDWRVHIPHPIHSDVEMLRTLLRNMVSNAIRHTSAGGRVTLECQSDDQNTIIEVRDTGEGMSEEQLQSLFQLPDKPRDPTEVGSKGAGFGMVLCHMLAQRMGGSLTASSQRGVGTTVSLTLPTHLCVESVEETMTPREDES